MKLRIAAAAAIGVVLVGYLARPLAAPADPLGVFRMPVVGINCLFVLGLAVISGFLAYFAAWPFGREIGILAVPAGLTIWSVAAGGMTQVILANGGLAQRQALYAQIKWEPLFWLTVVAAGFIGVLLAQKSRPTQPPAEQPAEKPQPKSTVYINTGIALVGSVLIGQFLVQLFAQDVRFFDQQLGFVTGQPRTGQIVFAILAAFAIVGFLAKKFLNVSYIWPAVASSLVTGYVVIAYLKGDTLSYLAGNWPAAFYTNTVLAILPVQMVTFGSLGAVAGYWMAVRFEYWQKHEI
jgi:hypothetical protein